jgi:hypothetical protein
MVAAWPRLFISGDFAIRKRRKPPVLGDYVKNDLAQPGRVTSVHFSHDGQDYIKVRANDGSVDLPLAPAEEFNLISRQA